MNAISLPTEMSPPPCRGRAGAVTPFHNHAIPTFRLQGVTRWLALAFLLCAATAHAEPFANGDAEAGHKFFTQNNCNRCHDGIMGGNGNAIFTRINHKVKNPQQLVDQMHVCTGNIGVTLTPQDEQNLGAYLNQHYYHFK